MRIMPQKPPSFVTITADGCLSATLHAVKSFENANSSSIVSVVYIVLVAVTIAL